MRSAQKISLICPICSNEHLEKKYSLYDDRYGYPGVFPLFHCNKCGHRYLQAVFSGKEIEKLYSQYYPRKNFDLNSFAPLSYVPGFKSWLNGEKRAFATIPPRVRVLDIGCGYGESVAYHKNRGCAAFGVEADSNVARIAKKFGLNIHIGVFKAGLFPANSFDYITMDQVVEHLPDPGSSLEAINAALVKGGRFVLTTPYSYGFGARLFRHKWIHWHAPYHLQHFSRKSLRLLAKRHGFIIEKVTTVTSSEWLRYQLIHNITFPGKGQKSSFWAEGLNDTSGIAKKLQWISRFHKYKINHLVTRFFDFFGFGDNLLVILKKSK